MHRPDTHNRTTDRTRRTDHTRSSDSAYDYSDSATLASQVNVVRRDFDRGYPPPPDVSSSSTYGGEGIDPSLLSGPSQLPFHVATSSYQLPPGFETPSAPDAFYASYGVPDTSYGAPAPDTSYGAPAPDTSYGVEEARFAETLINEYPHLAGKNFDQIRALQRKYVELARAGRTNDAGDEEKSAVAFFQRLNKHKSSQAQKIRQKGINYARLVERHDQAVMENDYPALRKMSFYQVGELEGEYNRLPKGKDKNPSKAQKSAHSYITRLYTLKDGETIASKSDRPDYSYLMPYHNQARMVKDYKNLKNMTLDEVIDAQKSYRSLEKRGNAKNAKDKEREANSYIRGLRKKARDNERKK